jgi:hypothetical protein
LHVWLPSHRRLRGLKRNVHTATKSLNLYMEP